MCVLDDKNVYYRLRLNLMPYLSYAMRTIIIMTKAKRYHQCLYLNIRQKDYLCNLDV